MPFIDGLVSVDPVSFLSPARYLLLPVPFDPYIHAYHLALNLAHTHPFILIPEYTGQPSSSKGCRGIYCKHIHVTTLLLHISCFPYILLLNSN